MNHSSDATLAVREMHEGDIDAVVSYWTDSAPDYLVSLGVDLDKLPPRDDLRRMLAGQLAKPYREKRAYALIWLIDGTPAGHSNLNPVAFGDEASMHLHLWRSGSRFRGCGVPLVRLSLPYYFDRFRLRRLVCEPYALNGPPHRVLEKAGFTFEREYTTVPGSINFRQPVRRWIMTRERYDGLPPATAG